MDGGDRTGAGRLILRFGIGAAEILGERLVAGLRAFDEKRATSPEAQEPEPPLEARHAVVGALAALPAWLDGALQRARASAQMQLRSTRGLRAVHRGRGWLARTPGLSRLSRRYDAWQARAEARVLCWAVEGRREERAGRALARLALNGFFEGAVAQVAESPELKQVIAEQSHGMTISAVNGLRERSARADSVAETLARRLLRRSE